MLIEISFIYNLKFNKINNTEITFLLLTKMTNTMQLCRIIYCSLRALHVSSDIFAHHQENLNCIYSFWYYSCMWLPAGVMDELEQSSNSSMTSAGSHIHE